MALRKALNVQSYQSEPFRTGFCGSDWLIPAILTPSTSPQGTWFHPLPASRGAGDPLAIEGCLPCWPC